MRMKNAKEVEVAGFNPVEGVELFVGIHDESCSTLCLICYGNHFRDAPVRAGEQSACLERNLGLDVAQHFMPMTFCKSQQVDHVIGR